MEILSRSRHRKGPRLGPLPVVRSASVVSAEPGAYGSCLVSLQEAPQTSALFLFGSVESVQLVFGLFLAAGSRYLKRNVTRPPGGAPAMVALKTAPLLASSLPPPHSEAGAWIAPCQLRMLLASPVGFQSEPATALYVMLPSGTTNVSCGREPPRHFPVMLTCAVMVIRPVKLVLKL